ncbi:cell surface glycoprotein MUC18 isoform X2 [Coregonus clupeaformis]|uniref:cell surface glycoprotein MUC18 isoform X2 n=1 Tax=Coregonus clupeaformis TaxID=59861 RepID=UPI001BE002E1|nr:cell surface glycoprotein MUC18 isoform X2 [Coregonus clupeaformis]
MALRMNASMFVGLFLLSLAWKAWAKVKVNMEDRVEVFLGDTAQITCMFTVSDSPDDVIIQWYMITKTNVRLRIYYGDSTMQVVDQGGQFTDKISVNGNGKSSEVVLTIRDVTLEDELEFICQVNGLSAGNEEGHTMLKVFESPAHPIIEGVHSGISVSNKNPSKIGSCEAKNGYPRPNITWYRNQSPLQNTPGKVSVVTLVTKESSGLYTVQSDLHLNVVKEDKDSLFYCEVSYLVPGGTKMTETNKINITVHYPTTSLDVWVESPKGRVKEGDTVEVHCRADGNPQPPFTFMHNMEEMKSELNVLVLKDVTRLSNGNITCTALDLDTYEETQGNTELFVDYLDLAILIPKDTHVMAQGEELMATCNALSSLPTHTEWFKKGEKVAEGHTLILKDAVFDMMGTYVCVVKVPSLEGLETSGSLHVLVQGPPEIKESADTVLEESTEKSLNLSCHARGYPTPVITWSSSDESQILKEVSHRQTEDGVLSVVRVKVTSDITAYCNASNDHGTDSISFSIKAIVQTTLSAPSTTVTTPLAPVTVVAPVTTVNPVTPPKRVKKEGSGVIIAVIIICILLLAILGSVMYFLYKKGKIPCGRSGKQDLTKPNKDSIVVEMKNDNTEEAVLLGVNGDKKSPSDQGDKYMDVQK